jgi:hypothetical protein
LNDRQGRVASADQIDRGRTNIELPKVITRQVFAVGSDSEIVGKILLTAVSLLYKGKFVRDGVDAQRAISISLDALTTVMTMTTMASAFEAAQQNACETTAAQQRSGHVDQMPFVGDIKLRCKAFMQQADHAVGDLLEIVRLFYTEIKKTPWDALYEKISLEFGDEDAFVRFLKNAVPFFKPCLSG